MAFFSKLRVYNCSRQAASTKKDYCVKSTKPFDECSICLERMIFITFGSRMLGFNTSRLSCGHCFHKQCFDIVKETSAYCPICRKTFFDTNEKLLLDGSYDVDYVRSMKPDRIDAVLHQAVVNKDDKLVALLIERHDPSEVLHHFIAEKDTRAVSQLLCSKCINWHKTVNGKTLLDIAAETNDNVIIHTVRSSKCYNNTHKRF